MSRGGWEGLAQVQCGLITRAQLVGCGVNRWAVRHRIDSGRWLELTPTVVATTTGPLSREQLKWLGVLHAGGDALLGDLTAAEHLGLRSWTRDHVTVLVTKDATPGVVEPVVFVGTRHPLKALARRGSELPCAAIEPAVLMFAARQRSARTADGVLAAAVQQRLTTPADLLDWIDRLRPLRGAPRMRSVLAEIGGGAHSVAELDLGRMCRAHRIRRPDRQVRRRDATGRMRYTDGEWRLADGRTLVLEVDGAFHMDVEHWEDDLARARALTRPDRLVVRCTSREVRDEPETVARDLIALGVPRA
ncbi:hypothetical protein [Nocardioides sp. MH1]|uniref:hypothetical protein n=1 Tax=Nocardioides sp. MH1 TaxID=3242490 RepID=UPI0035201E36